MKLEWGINVPYLRSSWRIYRVAPAFLLFHGSRTLLFFALKFAVCLSPLFEIYSRLLFTYPDEAPRDPVGPSSAGRPTPGAACDQLRALGYNGPLFRNKHHLVIIKAERRISSLDMICKRVLRLLKLNRSYSDRPATQWHGICAILLNGSPPKTYFYSWKMIWIHKEIEFF